MGYEARAARVHSSSNTEMQPLSYRKPAGCSLVLDFSVHSI
jgi:hypothetical protein